MLVQCQPELLDAKECDARDNQ